MTTLYYFRSSRPDLHAFTDDEAGAKLPQDQGPWRLVRAVVPEDGWTEAAEISVVEAGIRANGYSLVDSPGELSFVDVPSGRGLSRSS